MDTNRINQIYTDLCNIGFLQEINQTSLNQIVEDITDTFLISANKTFEQNKGYSSVSYEAKTPSWFGFKCKKARKNFHRLNTYIKSLETTLIKII
jgi:hypothetical protein